MSLLQKIKIRMLYSLKLIKNIHYLAFARDTVEKMVNDGAWKGRSKPWRFFMEE